MAVSPPSSAQAEFSRDLQRTLQRLRDGRLKVHIPRQQDLHRRRPDAHFHPNPELFIQTGGATGFVCPGDEFRLGTGDVCIMPRGVPHAETPLDGRSPYGVLVCMHARDGYYLHRGKADPARRIRGYGTSHVQTARTLFRYLDDLADHNAIPRENRRAYVNALLEAFLVTALAELEKPRAAAAPPASPLVREAEHFVRTHLADPKLSVAGLARALGCSPDHLARRFHQEHGIGPSIWIARERIHLARDLLADPRLNIAEVGWACGFNEPSYFIRVFRRHAGVTPRAHRLQSTGRG